MDARSFILQRIKANKPEPVELPQIPHFNRTDVDCLQHFIETLKFVGGAPELINSDVDLSATIKKMYPEAKKIAGNDNTLSVINVKTDNIQDPHALHDIDLVILRCPFGVAENAAVWVPSSIISHRALPFITQHMVFILPKDSLVWNMHEAYQKLSTQPMESYGVFISGPSKTADIEQSLVIGAHGSRSLTVFLA